MKCTLGKRGGGQPAFFREGVEQVALRAGGFVFCRKPDALPMGRAGRNGSGQPSWVVLAGAVFWLALFAGGPKPKVASVTLRAYHLLYPDYSQTLTVKMNQKFQLADTNLFVAIEDFVPHFAIDTVTHKVFSQSQELRNPAVKVAVFVGAEKKEEQWAFFKFSVPHFTRQTGLRFEVLKFTYNGKTYRREKPK